MKKTFDNPLAFIQPIKKTIKLRSTGNSIQPQSPSLSNVVVDNSESNECLSQTEDNSLPHFPLFVQEQDKVQVSPIQPSTLLSNVVVSNSEKNILNTYCLSASQYVEGDLDSPHFPLFSEDDIIETFGTDIIVPNKIYRTLYNHADSKLLKEIHEDKNVAIEYCMWFVHLLVKLSEVDEEDEDLERNYMCIASSRLESLFGWIGKSRRYTKILNVLYFGLDEPIVECNDEFVIGGKSLGYRFTDRYYRKGYHKYSLKTNAVKSAYLKSNYKNIADKMDNPIFKKLIDSYSYIDLPTIEEINEEAKRVVGKYTNKGKILKFKGKQSASYYKAGKYSFIEDNINYFKLLTDGGYIIPKIGTEKSGGRVVDSFTLMPSWIRKLCKINGQPIIQHDYSSLHPNILLMLYGTEEEQQAIGGDTHTKLAELFFTGAGDKDRSNPEFENFRQQIKIENLSFWNKRISHMKKSILWGFMWNIAPNTMQGVIDEKKAKGYIITSLCLFSCEVQLMTDIISNLPEDQKIIYVYDALYSNTDLKEIMNHTAVEYGLTTFVG